MYIRLYFKVKLATAKVCFLRYKKDEKVWKMRHARSVDFLAISRASESSLLLGTHLWDVHNDSPKCLKEGKTTYLANLTLHACSTENFACDNAFCIPMEIDAMLSKIALMAVTNTIVGN